jgi:broad specificity phosphatase PhoE
MDFHHRDADDAESFEDLYLRVQAFYDKLKTFSEDYAEKNLAIFSHGQLLQLLKMLVQQPRPLTKELMQEFRLELLRQPIKNTEAFIY